MTNNTTATEIRPFRIEFDDSALDDLRARLRGTRFPADMAGADGWERGVPTAYLRDLTTYWAEKFDWAAIEADLNRLPQFTTTVDGQNLHFLHVRSTRANATPLLLLHGWPGTVLDFRAMLAPLTEPQDPDAPAFDLVIPSLPGHGFSGPLTETGWTDGRVAAALAELMARLGYDSYGVHGGDHGAFLAPRLGRDDTEHVLGVHVNALVTFPTGDPAALSDTDRQRLAAMKDFQDNGSAYMQLAGSRPNTLAQLLSDSPAAQLAWIVEKYHEWTDAGRTLEESLDRDTILATATVYWLTDTARSVANYYYERFHDPLMFAPKPQGTTPTGVAVFPTADFAIRRFAERAHTVTHWSEFYAGGHFPALETPDLLTGDIQEFFRTLR
ncbi:epoxide hydrolase family protein [Nocardia stercoris]|uniref:Epoxide hydrolase n=1 Tax=Nocardia stercoris TaxID=2483361 RepID=A0A3M2L9P4_9NOCA|nr:epoxide hydrolase [Nocardia stercoris]RMI34311.1 epoxide hydrolase [Nocardia stercoris]